MAGQEQTRPEITARVIGLCGAAGSGKSTVAAILEGCGFTRVRFADPLKSMFSALLSAEGLLPGYIARCIEGDLKETPLAALGGRSPRHAMQTLGTEWGRTCMDRDFWANITRRKIDVILADGGRVVVEDCRFLNEAAVIKGSEVQNMTGQRELWQVVGRGGIAGDHPSEAGADHLGADLVLDNAAGLSELRRAVHREVLG